MKALIRLLAFSLLCFPALAQNLLPDASCEERQPKNQFGVPYVKWSGWVFEGSPEFRNASVARTGETCAEIVGVQGGKIRLDTPAITVAPGRYRFSCYIRGLDVGKHAWNVSEDFSFADDKYYSLQKMGTFGWTKLEMVKDVPKKQEIVARIGLWVPGRLWVDDAEIVKVGPEVPVTEAPVLGDEEKPIAPPATLIPGKVVRCVDCGYQNMPEWGKRYVCGESLGALAQVREGPPVRPLQVHAGVRHEVPALVALELLRGRPVLCAGLPRG